MNCKKAIFFDKSKIIKKWYKILLFDKKFDKRFLHYLNTTNLSDITDFVSYDYKNNTPQKNLLACLYFCDDLAKKYIEKGISETILVNTLSDLVIWNDSYYKVYGDIGLTEFPWIDRTFLMQIFRLGRLQFSMFPSEFDIEEIGVKKNDPVLEVHIPRGGVLNYEDCENSFKEAKVFFRKYYPDFPQKWCSCHSWLLDEGIVSFLGAKSNIVKFQKFFKPIFKYESDSILRFVFKWNTTRENLDSCEPTSNFSCIVKDKALSGYKFYEVVGVRLL